MTTEDILKRRMAEILLKETPYVLEEARFGMFDIAVYIPEDSVFEELKECKSLSAARACNRYLLDGNCNYKKDRFLSNFEPVYNEQGLQEGFKDRRTNQILYLQEFSNLISNKKLMRQYMACDLEETGKNCEYLDNKLVWEKGFLAGNKLKQGLHLFEFKSDHDNINRFLEQLPHYSIFADYIWLVLGSAQKVPKWLPSYVGVYKEEGEVFVKVKESEFIRRLPPLSNAVLRECGTPDGIIDGKMFYSFIRKWFINSIFYRSNGLAIPMHELDHIFKHYIKEDNKRAKQSTLKF